MVYDRELKYVRCIELKYVRCIEHGDLGEFWDLSIDCHRNLYAR